MNKGFDNIISSYDQFQKDYYNNTINKKGISKGDQPLIDSFRIYLTENCNASCAHCFNASIREKKEMDFDKAIILFRYLKNNNINNLKIMGGEPTIYPFFKEIFVEAQNNFESLGLFTNALNNVILGIRPRKEDYITYNFIFINKQFNFNKLLPKIDAFYRIFEVVIDTKTILTELFSKLDFTYLSSQKLGISEYIRFQLTLNCMEDIILNNNILNKKLLSTVDYIIKNYGYTLTFDHKLPICFWQEGSLKRLDELKIEIYKETCSGNDAGLIDSEFNLLHCNQHPIKLFNIFESENLPSLVFIENTLMKANLEKRIINYNKGCSGCKYFLKKCTGSCFAHKKFINVNPFH
jgi:4Fe-4S single cluster domain